MTYDVFVSHSSKDKSAVEPIRAALEDSGVRCWLAPRDILPGREWGEAIIDGIEGSRVLLLVLSSNANDSTQIVREVERAANRRLAIVPLRIEDVTPSKSLEYFISSSHWQDAFTPPLEQHLPYLVQAVKELLGQASDAVISPQPKPTSKTRKFPVWLIAAIAIVALAAAYFAIVPSGPIESAFVGRWEFLDAANNVTWEQTNRRDGGYDVTMVQHEQGTFDRLPDGRLNLTAANRSFGLSSWRALDANKVNADGLVPPSFLLIINFYSGGKGGTVPYNDVAAMTWTKTGGNTNEPPDPRSKTPQTWLAEVVTMGLNLRFETQFGPGPSYRITSRMTDEGKLQARDGQFSALNGSSAVHRGPYQVIDDDTISMGAGPFQQTWRRLE